MTQTRKLLAWAMLLALVSLVSYAGFRGYQHPELLLHFAHAISC